MLRSVLQLHHNKSLPMARKTWFLMGSQTGYMKVSAVSGYKKLSTPAFPFTLSLLPEEMFSSGQGFWWSPGGRHVAYIESNDTEVHRIEYSWYGQDQYPSTVSIPYPKVGRPVTGYMTVTGVRSYYFIIFYSGYHGISGVIPIIFCIFSSCAAGHSQPCCETLRCGYW